MDIRDVRIGNYVDLYGSIAKLRRSDYGEVRNYITYESDIKCIVSRDSKFDMSNIGCIALDSGKPIPLNKDWLIKFGFKPLVNDWQKNGIIIHTRKRGFVLRKSVPIIKYVHQLQNLYYALTGDELE